MKRYLTLMIPALYVFAMLIAVGCNNAFVDSTPQGESMIESPVADAGADGSSDTGASDQQSGQPVVVDESNFEQVVLQSDKPVLVDFWATWCGPCRTIAPTVKELAKEYQGRAVIAKLDVDVAGKIAQKYNINAIPALVVFHNGEEVSRVVGAVGKSELAGKLEATLSDS